MQLLLSIYLTAFLGVSNAAALVTRCTGTISSLDDVAAAVKCTTIVINGFTVPAGKSLDLSLIKGSTVNLKGNVVFAHKEWAGPLFSVSGTDITFNGNGFALDGNGAQYWDGLGTNGGTTKPHPMVKVKISGTFEDVIVKNSPAQAISVSNPAALVIDGVTVDNSAGDSAGGHNTDGFDASTTDLTIQNSIIKNQDDCIAINKGSNIKFLNNKCSGGHGISIGSIQTGSAVSDITISGNTITNSDQALRIKTVKTATDASVTGVTYSGNTASNIKKYGVIIDQSYPSTLGTPGTGVKVSAINFTGSKNTIAVASTAKRVEVNCGSGACTGTWDWSKLTVTGGSAGAVEGFSGISGGSFA